MPHRGFGGGVSSWPSPKYLHFFLAEYVLSGIHSDCTQTSYGAHLHPRRAENGRKESREAHEQATAQRKRADRRPGAMGEGESRKEVRGMIAVSVYITQPTGHALFTPLSLEVLSWVGTYSPASEVDRIYVMESGPRGSACQNDTRSIRPPPLPSGKSSRLRRRNNPGEVCRPVRIDAYREPSEKAIAARAVINAPERVGRADAAYSLLAFSRLFQSLFSKLATVGMFFEVEP